MTVDLDYDWTTNFLPRLILRIESLSDSFLMSSSIRETQHEDQCLLYENPTLFHTIDIRQYFE